MLPKFANNLFGHFPRTANSFKHGFFNSSQGSTAGGAKYNAGSRFYSNGYNGAGRAVTQANNITSQDDDGDRRLPRLSLLSRNTTGYTTAGRLPHPHFARARRYSTSTAPATELEKGHPSSLPPFSPGPASVVHTRSATPSPPTDATSTKGKQNPVVAEPQDSNDASLPSLENSLLGDSGVYAGLDLPDAGEGESELAGLESGNIVPGYDEIKQSIASKDYTHVLKTVKKYRTSEEYTVKSFNMALVALAATRPAGSSINDILETYNDMLSKSITPNQRTYRVVLGTLCTRDAELQRVIIGLETRMKRRELAGVGYHNSSSHQLDAQRIEELKKESPFNSALLIFQAMISMAGGGLPQGTYCQIIDACARHRTIEPAIRVFAHFERYSRDKPGIAIYRSLISVYSACRDVQGAREVFNEFLRLSKEGRIQWPSDVNQATPNILQAAATKSRSGIARIVQTQIWTDMIKVYFRDDKPAEAIALLEKMIQTPMGAAFGAEDPPLPSAATYTAIVTGFFRNGDLDTALSWFNRLLQQPKGSYKFHVPLVDPPRPTLPMWTIMIDSLAKAGPKYTQALNQLWMTRLEHMQSDALEIQQHDRAIVVQANLTYITEMEKQGTVTQEKRKEIVDFLREKVIHFTGYSAKVAGIPLLTSTSDQAILGIVEQCIKIGKDDPEYVDVALRMTIEFAKLTQQAVKNEVPRRMDGSNGLDSFREHRHRILNRLQSLILRGRTTTDSLDPPKLTLAQSLDLATALIDAEEYPPPLVALYYTRLYVEMRRESVPELTKSQWSTLCHLAGTVYSERTSSYAVSKDFPALPDSEAKINIQDLLKDMAANGMKAVDLMVITRRDISLALIRSLGIPQAVQFFKSLGPDFRELAESTFHGHPVTLAPNVVPAAFVDDDVWKTGLSYPVAAEQPVPSSQAVYIDDDASRYVDAYFPSHHTLTPIDGYERFKESIKSGRWPRPDVIGRLINALGRLKETEAVKSLYNSAQLVLASMADNKEQQSLAWFQVEDQMVIAWAHAGDLEAAHIHRGRILQQNGTPSADAYGALISGIKDTTDDVTSALQLWTESQSRGVRPNQYLYNTVISRLAKARKAEHALELFHDMKAKKVPPSTVTYGAVITACCRVGDAHSAEELFQEMRGSRRYQPRVPPFNTIMQLFTTTKPDREKVEHYYKLMRDEVVPPSDHTYKLLLDAYGSIHPVDMDALWRTFKALERDKRARVNGTHWASILNACGSVQKDLAKAQAVFDKIDSHPSSRTGPIALPDAVVYEAMFNVLVTHHRADLFDVYLRKMNKHGVHMTAYIANIIIKGYASAGKIEEARSIFESLSDPPVGVAAPDNRVPHDFLKVKPIASNAPVYREPSTWEAMIRAEIGAGNRQDAIALLQRMQYRGYPPAVLQRVGGILHHELDLTQDTYSSIDTSNSSHSPASDQSTLGSSTPPSSVY